MQLTKSQEKAVDQLFDEYMGRSRRIVDFKAPTGSGKTFISANFISKVFGANLSNKTMVIIATVSNAELPKAFAKKLVKYKKYLPFSNFEVEFRESPSATKNIKIEHVKEFDLSNNKVLVFGTSSFGRKKIFTENGLLENFIDEAKHANWNIIYIRDEAHKGGMRKQRTSEIFYRRFEEKMVDIANFVIQMTATPRGYNDLIELTEKDLLDDSFMLLKNVPKYNEFQRNTFTSKDLIRECLKKFQEVQEEYKKLPNFIRPALLIQVDSKSQNITQEEYDKTIEKIIFIVRDEFQLNYMKYFSSDVEGNAKEDLSLESASKNDSNYDVIIFKVGPATGWDIPRACMLLQIREVSSESLNIQTIGRIKRNPMKNLVCNDITNNYYIYSNYQEGRRFLASYKLKDIFNTLKLYQGNLLLEDNYANLIEDDFFKKIKIFLKKTSIEPLLSDNSRKSSLSIENRIFSNKNATNNQYSLFVNSIFKLKLWNDSIVRKNKKYFTKGLMLIINQLAKKLSISDEVVKYTIIKECFVDIKNKYHESYELERNKEKYVIVPGRRLSKNYQMWISSNKRNKFDITHLHNYGYTLIKGIHDKHFKDIQFLDSNPETEFMKSILEAMEEEGYHSQVKFFSKMPTLQSEIFFEYLNTKDNEKHKAFIDFILIQGKRNLMIEVKGWSDYDPNKTRDLLYAFDKYKEQNDDKNVELLICYSGKKDGKYLTPKIKFKKDGDIYSIYIKEMLKNFFEKK